jgi:hypothetical protein
VDPGDRAALENVHSCAIDFAREKNIPERVMAPELRVGARRKMRQLFFRVEKTFDADRSSRILQRQRVAFCQTKASAKGMATGHDNEFEDRLEQGAARLLTRDEKPSICYSSSKRWRQLGARVFLAGAPPFFPPLGLASPRPGAAPAQNGLAPRQRAARLATGLV